MNPEHDDYDPLEGESPDSNFDGLLPQGKPADASAPASASVPRPARDRGDSAGDSAADREQEVQEHVVDEEAHDGEEEGLLPVDEGTPLPVDSAPEIRDPETKRTRGPDVPPQPPKSFDWRLPLVALLFLLVAVVGVVAGILLTRSDGVDPDALRRLEARVDQLNQEKEQLAAKATQLDQRTATVETEAQQLARTDKTLEATDATLLGNTQQVQQRVQQAEATNSDQETRLRNLEQLPAAAPSLASLLATEELTEELLREIQRRVETEPLLDEELRMVAAWAERRHEQGTTADAHKELLVSIAIACTATPGRAAAPPTASPSDTSGSELSDGTRFVAWQQPDYLQVPAALEISGSNFDAQLWRKSVELVQQVSGLAAARGAAMLGNLSLKYEDLERASYFAGRAEELLRQVPAASPDRNAADLFSARLDLLKRDLRQLELAGQVKDLQGMVARLNAASGGTVAVNVDVFRQVLDSLEARIKDLGSQPGAEQLRQETRNMLADLRAQLQPNLPASQVAQVLVVLQRISLQVTQWEHQQSAGSVVESLADANQIVAFLDQLDVAGMQPTEAAPRALPLWSRLAEMDAALRQDLAGKQQLPLAELSRAQLKLLTLVRQALLVDMAAVRVGDGGNGGGPSTVKIVSSCCSRLVTIAGAGNDELALSLRQLRQDLRMLQDSISTRQLEALAGAQRELHEDVRGLRGDVRAVRADLADVRSTLQEQAQMQQSEQQARRAEFQGLQAEVRRDLQRPRPLPQEQVDMAVSSVLAKLAEYGYAPSSPASPEAIGRPPSAGPESVTPRIDPERPPVNPALASEMYGAGRRAFFSGNLGVIGEAVRYFGQAVRYDPQEPIYRYYLALALHCSGRDMEAQAQVRAARQLETTTARQRVAASLERVQGPPRQWLESTRLSF